MGQLDRSKNGGNDIVLSKSAFGATPINQSSSSNFDRALDQSSLLPKSHFSMPIVYQKTDSHNNLKIPSYPQSERSIHQAVAPTI